MKKAKAARVQILENAFELNLPKLMRAAKATGDSRVVLDDGVTRTVAVLAEMRLAVLLGGQQWVVNYCVRSVPPGSCTSPPEVPAPA